MTCAEYHRWFSPYVDEQLTRQQRADFEEHLKGCAGCREDLASLQQMLRALRTMASPIPPELLLGIHAKLQHESWWQTVARRFLAPWPQSLPLHGLAVATTAVAIVIAVRLPSTFRHELPGQSAWKRAARGDRLAAVREADRTPIQIARVSKEAGLEDHEAASSPAPAAQPGDEFKKRPSASRLQDESEVSGEQSDQSGRGTIALNSRTEPTGYYEPSDGKGTWGQEIQQSSEGDTRLAGGHDADHMGDVGAIGGRKANVSNERLAQLRETVLAKAEPVTSTSEVLRASVSSRQPVFSIGAPIALRVTLQNLGDTPVELVDPRKVGRDLLFQAQVIAFDIQDASGYMIPYEGPMVDYYPGEEQYRTRLAPGESLTVDMTINDSDDEHGRYRLDPPGTYQLKARYHGLILPNPYTADPNDTMIGMVTSDPIAIEVASSPSSR